MNICCLCTKLYDTLMIFGEDAPSVCRATGYCNQDRGDWVERGFLRIKKNAVTQVCDGVP